MSNTSSIVSRDRETNGDLLENMRRVSVDSPLWPMIDEVTRRRDRVLKTTFLLREAVAMLRLNAVGVAQRRDLVDVVTVTPSDTSNESRQQRQRDEIFQDFRSLTDKIVRKDAKFVARARRDTERYIDERVRLLSREYGSLRRHCARESTSEKPNSANIVSDNDNHEFESIRTAMSANWLDLLDEAKELVDRSISRQARICARARRDVGELERRRLAIRPFLEQPDEYRDALLSRVAWAILNVKEDLNSPAFDVAILVACLHTADLSRDDLVAVRTAMSAGRSLADSLRQYAPLALGVGSPTVHDGAIARISRSNTDFVVARFIDGRKVGNRTNGKK